MNYPYRYCTHSQNPWFWQFIYFIALYKMASVEWYHTIKSNNCSKRRCIYRFFQQSFFDSVLRKYIQNMHNKSNEKCQAKKKAFSIWNQNPKVSWRRVKLIERQLTWPPWLSCKIRSVPLVKKINCRLCLFYM